MPENLLHDLANSWVSELIATVRELQMDCAGTRSSEEAAVAETNKLLVETISQRQEIERLKGLLYLCKNYDSAMRIVSERDEARQQIDRLTREKDSAEKSCAAMREALELWENVWLNNSDLTYAEACSASRIARYSSTAGHGFVRREVLETLPKSFTRCSFPSRR